MIESKKESIIALRLTASEKRQIKRNAYGNMQNISEYLRDLGLSNGNK